MEEHYHPDSGMWEFVIVTEPVEKIWVVTKRGVPVHKKAKRAGYRGLLGIGDKVFVEAGKIKGGPKWYLKFRLMMRPPRRRPYILYGKHYGGPRYASLGRLTAAAFENAGIDPARKEHR
jgi:hypothetical protein